MILTLFFFFFFFFFFFLPKQLLQRFRLWNQWSLTPMYSTISDESHRFRAGESLFVSIEFGKSKTDDGFILEFHKDTTKPTTSYHQFHRNPSFFQ
ncbi:hypothetical protein FGIG_02416 [Fasciola gigantica]|uniref:Uncharacterized protein n=1 Tax=Fasciola gigantica TaxID=46835 RepID=A0A504Y824_FASGI|nr:hypothetical protein FGIG_02416 [Fasciola gigantica]